MNAFKKLFAIDLDGTLLKWTKKISKPSFAALAKYVAAGGEVIIITGKNISAGMKHIRKIEKTLNIVLKYAGFLGGSVVYDTINEKVVAEDSLNETHTKSIYETALKHKTSVIGIDEVEGDEIFYMNRKWWFNFFMKQALIHHRTYMKLKSYLPFKAYKIDACCLNKHRINDFVAEIENHQMYHVAKMNNIFVEITAKDANKAFALNHICDLLKVDLKDTAAIGDSSNDIAMLEIAGTSFGIGCEHNDLFQKVSQVKIKRSQKHPVAYAINNYLLANK